MKIHKNDRVGSTQNDLSYVGRKSNFQAMLFAEISVGVGELFRRGPRVARSSQPWAECWNPFGIPRIASLRFTVTSVFAVMLLAAPTLRAQLVADGATNTLSNTTNTFTDVTVGTNGSFTLLILSNNALLTNSGNGTIGLNTAAKSNEVRLLSPSARWLMGGSLFVGSNGSFNRLVVSNGAFVRNNSGSLGLNFGSSNNLALATGPGSVWSNA